jgi:hypothetical protein
LADEIFRSFLMRLLILIAGAALLLSACGNKGQTDNTANLDESQAAENIVANDVTAIDAVTGDAANMAADVEIPNELEANLDNAVNAAKPLTPPTPRTRRPGKPPLEQPAPAETAPTNNAA